MGDLGSVTGLGRSPGEGKGYPLQYSGLENSMDCIAHGVAKSQTEQLSLLSLHFRSLLKYFLKKRKKNLQTLNLYEEQSDEGRNLSRCRLWGSQGQHVRGETSRANSLESVVLIPNPPEGSFPDTFLPFSPHRIYVKL